MQASFLPQMSANTNTTFILSGRLPPSPPQGPPPTTYNITCQVTAPSALAVSSTSIAAEN